MGGGQGIRAFLEVSGFLAEGKPHSQASSAPCSSLFQERPPWNGFGFSGKKHLISSHLSRAISPFKLPSTFPPLV